MLYDINDIEWRKERAKNMASKAREKKRGLGLSRVSPIDHRFIIITMNNSNHSK